ncbi:M42 family metallopeptidase [Agrobacterium rubi]|nr:M42 family metallopeptidase [Agrobacterium rubi]NTF24092.1 M42 family metallopeptidase [Agrobacterium rubi]
MEDMYLDLEFFGSIETTEAFKDLVTALTKLDDYEDDANAARQALVEANLEGQGFKIDRELYNYRSDAVEAIMQVAKKHKIDLVCKLTGGGMDDAGTIQFVRNGWVSIKLPIMNGEVMLDTKVIGKLKKTGMTTLDQLDDFLANFKVADQPKFTVSDEVIAEIFIPKRKA